MSTGTGSNTSDRAWLNTLTAASNAGPLERFFGGGPDGLREALKILDETNDWTLVPRLLPLALGKSTDIASRTTVALRRLLDSVPTADLPRLDKQVRQELSDSPYYGPRFAPGWTNVTPEGVSRRAVEMGSALVSLCTFHPNGWVRSAALVALGKHFLSDGFPYILLRLADWVPAIRAEALQLCERTMAPGNERVWCNGLSLLELVGRSTRAAESPLKDRVHAYLQTVAGRTALGEAMRSPDRDTRTHAFRFLLAPPNEATIELLSVALTDKDPCINRLAVERLVSSQLGKEICPALREGMKSKQPIVRRHCLDAYAQLNGIEAKDEIVAGLRDRAAVVRGVARHHARKLSVVSDVVGFYRDLLGSHLASEVAVAMASLGELNALDTWPLLKPYLWARQPHLRCLTLRVGVELGRKDIADWLWEALSDREPPVTNLARRLLAQLDADALEPGRAVHLAVNQRKPELARLNATRLIRAMGKWKQPAALIQVAQKANGVVAQLAVELLLRWNQNFNSSGTQPSASQVTAISQELDFAKNALPDGLSEWLRFALKPWQSGDQR